jgi:phage terminase large subunit GpA-like protein
MSSASLKALWAGVYAGLATMAPPPALTISQWADQTIVLSREEASEPGPWRTARAPYLREMMDCLNDPNIESAVYMVGSQLGKTACLKNVAFYFAHNDPSPCLIVMPTKDQVSQFSTERIATGIDASPKLKAIFGSQKSRAAGNTVLNKSFPGGYFAMVGANVPRDLASRSCRIVLASEVDGMNASVGVEGDPIALMTARATNFWNRKLVFESTPTNKGESVIERLEASGDQRRYFVPCPQCGEFQTLEFDQLKWPGRDRTGELQKVSDCYYVCIHNGCVITEAEKPAMLRKGQWCKTNLNPVDAKCASFQLSTMYSPWFKWPEMAQQYLKAGKNDKLLKVFTNTRLGLTYEVTGETADDESLLKRRIVYPARVPAGVLVLTCGVDVQGNRLEYEIVGWGLNEQSWSIDYGILRGDPAMPPLWQELDERVLKPRYRHTSGTQMRIASAFVDSSDGNHTKRIYWFCRPRQVRRIYACKGVPGPGQTLIRPRAQRTHRGNVDLRLVGVDTAKESLYSNLREDNGGTGYCFFPSAYVDEFGVKHPLPVYDEEHFKQLTAEQLVSTTEGMTTVKKWEKKRPRNEALDCRVYAMAALEDLGVNWKKLAENMSKKRSRPERAEIASDIAETADTLYDALSDANQHSSQPRTMSKKKKIPLRMPGFDWIHR